MSKAAKQLYVSQPALSRRLTALEKELGVPLFERENGRLILNKDGKELLRQAREVERIFQDIKEYFRRRADPGRPVTIYSIDNNFSFFMKNYFSYDTKPIQLKVLPSDQIVEPLLLGEADAVIADDGVIPEPAQESLSRIPLMKEFLLLVVPKGHELARLKTVDIRDLSGYRLMHQSSMQWLSEVMNRNQVNLNLSWSVDTETWNYYWTHYDREIPPCFIASSAFYSRDYLRANLNKCVKLKVEGEYTQRMLYLWYYNANKAKLNEFIQCVKLSFT
ncbi:MAG: LysR family transcriptional regulator [Oscillospiraceae bacterium]|nr:LysR family transcriptional regulator [Oscillospiraceae bacterium]